LQPPEKGDGVINGFHSLVYSDDPVATRAFFRDVLGWPFVDADEGWLIFKTPPSEIGFHPSQGDHGEPHATPPHHAVSLMCDDIEATIAELRAKGVDVGEKAQNYGYGLVTMIKVPGAGPMQLYQPLHPVAYGLPND
jgi:catechol 2,3-dioxygenase-like lactoylglutathione lyase family enzyme